MCQMRVGAWGFAKWITEALLLPRHIYEGVFPGRVREPHQGRFRFFPPNLHPLFVRSIAAFDCGCDALIVPRKCLRRRLLGGPGSEIQGSVHRYRSARADGGLGIGRQ